MVNEQKDDQQPKKKSQVQQDAEAIELSISLNKNPLSIVPSLEAKYGITSYDIQRILDKKITPLELLNSKTKAAAVGEG